MAGIPYTYQAYQAGQSAGAIPTVKPAMAPKNDFTYPGVIPVNPIPHPSTFGPAPTATQATQAITQNAMGTYVAGPDTNRSGSGGFQNPVAGNIENAIRIWESMAGPAAPAGPAYVYAGGTPQARFQETQSQISRPGDPRMQSTGGYPAARTEQKPAGVPYQAIPVPKLPDYKSPEYKPPVEDPGVYKAARRESMGPGMRALQEGTRNAITTSMSLDNPNARAQFIRQALQGYGQGLENVSAGASREARGIAQDKRREQLSIYDAKYSNLSNDARANYQNELNTIAANFAQQQMAANSAAAYGQAPATTQLSPSGRPISAELQKMRANSTGSYRY